MHTDKTLATVLAETKDELKQFIDTRLQILKSELSEKLRTWKYSVPLLIGAAVLLLAGWITLTFAFVAIIAALFQPSAYAWAWGGLIVAGVYLIAGGVIGWFGYSELTSVSVAPTRTLKVLKQDQVWIQNETRAA